MISPYETFTTHAPYTYIYVTHLTILWKNLQAYNIQPKIKFFHWFRQCCQYLHPYTISPYEIFTMHAPYTYIHVLHLKVLWKNLQAYNFGDSV